MNNSTMECIFRNKAILLYTSFYYCTDSKSYYYNNSPTDDIIRRYLGAKYLVFVSSRSRILLNGVGIYNSNTPYRRQFSNFKRTLWQASLLAYSLRIWHGESVKESKVRSMQVFLLKKGYWTSITLVNLHPVFLF